MDTRAFAGINPRDVQVNFRLACFPNGEGVPLPGGILGPTKNPLDHLRGFANWSEKS